MKKIITGLLAMLMIVSSLGVMNIGVIGEPIQDEIMVSHDIANLADLQAMDTHMGMLCYLTADIDASDSINWNSGAGFVPVGNSSTPFTGTFDGNGFTIKNLHINRPGDSYVGLFGVCSGDVHDLKLINADFHGAANTGGIAGKFMTGNLTQCSVSGSINGAGLTGGLIGSLYGGTVNSSYSTATITGSFNVGGVIGYADTGLVTLSFSSGNVTGTGNNVGGFIGASLTATVTNCYCTGGVSSPGNNVAGFMGMGGASFSYSTGRVTGGTTLGGFSSVAICPNCYWDTNTTGQATSAGGTGAITSTLLMQATYTGWDFTNTWFSVDGSTRPFLRMEHDTTIRNSHQVQLMQMNLTADYTLANDIDMDITNNASMWGTSVVGGEGFYSIGTSVDRFSGSLDGQDYNITGLFINRTTTDYVGLFGYLQAGTVNGVSLVDFNNTGFFYTAGLVGWNSPGSTINNCSVNGNLTGIFNSNNVGGIAGLNNGLVSNCYATGTVSGHAFVGGIVGQQPSGTIDNCYSTCNVTGTYVGGILGTCGISSTVKNSYSTGHVDGDINVGGLVGTNRGTVSNCTSNGTVTGKGNNVGGLIGFGSGPVSNSKSFGDVFNLAPTGDGDNYYGTGGLIGALEGATATVSSSEAYGNVSGCKFHTGGLIGHIAPGATVMNSSAHGFTIGAGNNIGGLAGRNEGTVLNCSAYGDTGDTKSWTGGLVGSNYGAGLILNSSAHGDVFGGSITGGFVGDNRGIIERSYSTGDVLATSDRVGGFVGWNSGISGFGDITDCYSQGNITGGDDDGIGGFVGNNTSGASITNVYSTGLVTGILNTGGLVGVNWISTVTDSHWDIETSGQGTSVDGEGNPTIEMMQEGTFTNWDFTNVWGIVEANTYPFLRALETGFTADADLEITLTDLQDPASTNGTLTYLLTLTNHGPHNAADVYVNITLPTEVSFLDSTQSLNVNGRYLDADVGTLLNGDSVEAFINVTVNSLGSGELNCTANVTSTTLDPGAFDNETYELTQLHLAPVAVNDAETLDEDSGASTIYVLKNDTDAENDDITIIEVTQPNNGTVIITEAGKNLTFEPDVDWNGINIFNYTIMDALGGKDMATVTITVLSVDDVSIAVNDTYSVAEDSGATTLDVLANDYDGDGDAITISTAIQPANGTISIATNGLSIDYTPNADFFGTDSFTYNVSSGIEPATVTVTVTPVNDVPVIATTDIITATEGVFYSVDYNATDIDLDTLIWTLTTNASWLSIVAGDGILSGTPTGAGIYWVNVTVDDGKGGLDWSNFTLTVTGIEIIIEPTDTDGDGTPDDDDDFPNDANETTDTDGDGTGDNGDAFPDDPAASVDADDDGLPDAWNDGYTAEDSTTGLVLDDDVVDDDTDDDASNNSWLYIIIILAIVGAIAGYMVMRGKGKEPEAETEAIPEEISEEIVPESTEI